MEHSLRVGLELCINVLCTKSNIPTNIWFLLKNFSSFSMLVSYHQSDTQIEESDQIDAPKSKSTSCLEGDTEVYTFQLRINQGLTNQPFPLSDACTPPHSILVLFGFCCDFFLTSGLFRVLQCPPEVMVRGWVAVRTTGSSWSKQHAMFPQPTQVSLKANV